MIKKTSMETLTVTTDRDFKHRAVNFMNNIAFQAEKFVAAGLDEAQMRLVGSARVLNVIVDGNVMGDDLNNHFDKLKLLCKKPNVMILLYLTEDQMKAFAHNDHGLKNLKVHELPFNKTHYNEAFHLRGKEGTSMPFGGDGGVVFKKLNDNGSKPKKAAPPPKSITAFEASDHVRETVAMVNALAGDRSNLQLLQDIGQRFNGFMGAFAFLGNNQGMSELKNLAEIIDSIARTYDGSDEKEITEQHFQLLLNSAKLVYRTLQVLRDNKTIPQEFLDGAKTLFIAFEKIPTLSKRSSNSQSEIDDLLSDLDDVGT